MNKRLIILISVLFIFGLIYGQEKTYYDTQRNITKDISSATEYSIVEKTSVREDTILKKTSYFISNIKKSEETYLNKYNNGNLISHKPIGEKWEWYENGNVHLKAIYIAGKLHGEFITYWPNGTQKRKDTYGEGELIEGVCYDSTGVKSAYYPYQTAPSFPGGEQMLFKFLANNIKYPVIAQESNIQGKVVVQFYVETNGKITDLKIIRNVDFYLNKEAFRVIESMPDWNPATIDGLKIRAKYILPVSFVCTSM